MQKMHFITLILIYKVKNFLQSDWPKAFLLKTQEPDFPNTQFW